jgi:hypothetical protein
LDIVRENPLPDPNDPENSWDYSELSKNPSITWDIVRNNPYPNPEDPEETWDFKNLSENPNITWDIVRNNPVPDPENPRNTWDFSRLNLKIDREKYIINCLNKDRYSARKALMPTTDEVLITGQVSEENPKQNLDATTAHKVFGNKELMGNIMSNLGGRRKQGKKTVKKRKTTKRKNNKKSRKSKKSRRRM